MKNILCILLVLSLLASCNTIPERGNTTSVVKEANTLKQFEGSYEGDFGGSGIIRLILLHVEGSNASGYSLHKGLQRNMSGDVSEDKDGYHFFLKEPGDSQYDGTFDFVIDRSGNTLTGTWKPLNDKDLKPTSFILKKAS